MNSVVVFDFEIYVDNTKQCKWPSYTVLFEGILEASVIYKTLSKQNCRWTWSWIDL